LKEINFIFTNIGNIEEQRQIKQQFYVEKMDLNPYQISENNKYTIISREIHLIGKMFIEVVGIDK
jgi:hypothetical protein